MEPWPAVQRLPTRSTLSPVHVVEGTDWILHVFDCGEHQRTWRKPPKTQNEHANSKLLPALVLNPGSSCCEATLQTTVPHIILWLIITVIRNSFVNIYICSPNKYTLIINRNIPPSTTVSICDLFKLGKICNGATPWWEPLCCDSSARTAHIFLLNANR